MTEKQLTDDKIIFIIKEEFTNFLIKWSDDMTFGEKLLFTKIEDDVVDGVSDKLGDVE